MAATTATHLIAHRWGVEGTRQRIDGGIAWLRRRGVARDAIETHLIEQVEWR